MQASSPRINSERLWGALMQLATIGATPAGGVCRLALSEEDRQAREQLMGWCRQVGCVIEIDAVGNIFARREGRSAGAPVVMSGSHLDTQPNGGRFDGAYGVMAALEVLRVLHEQHITTDHAFELVVWSNEEGTRFAPSMMGSMAFAGLLSERDVLDRKDMQGRRYGDALAAIGQFGQGRSDRLIAAYYEAHIEQGPILERENCTIGVVTGGQGQKWFDLTLNGQAAHAGSTPMAGRRDALLGAARIIDALRKIATRFAPGVATVGELHVTPNSRNVIPGQVMMTIEIRHPRDSVRDQMEGEFRQALGAIASDECLTFSVETKLTQPATVFDTDCVSRVRDAARRLGYRHMDIVSGAAHDAIAIARVAPTAMIFVPCAGGISHDESESATPDDLAAGAEVLLQAVLESCRRI
ncbi:MAG: hypothetical protein RL676_1324 [Pseudomonadota bacterium]